MKPRRLDQREHVAVPGRVVERSVTVHQVEAYLRATGWRQIDDEDVPPPGRHPIPSPRDPTVPLPRIIEMIAEHEKRPPADVLRDIAEGRGLERWLRKRKRWIEDPDELTSAFPERCRRWR